ncbi:hypothetical protein BC936DRAFT_137073 [Jimgerdemannia flammicorona]|uniref:Peptidoglycan binding-like domain-containing protein n=1 Tax=Jimgerdemannia flammicorona TaxID=994334 RepID=A0A433CY51_9FUNG|nr:hypothetical protein BC936DRAFT_137073 [Jimgerdemannia flammicorona]
MKQSAFSVMAHITKCCPRDAYSNHSSIWQLSSACGTTWARKTFLDTETSVILSPGHKLYSKLGNIRSAVSKRLGRPILMSWPDLRPGNNGANVRALQHLLCGHGVKLKIDNSYGPMVYRATVKFQEKHQIPADGYVRESTWLALIESPEHDDKGKNLKHQALAVQTILRQNNLDIELTGVFDDQTRKGIHIQQTWRGLDPTGELDVNTWCAILGGATPAEERLPPVIEFGPVIVPENLW